MTNKIIAIGTRKGLFGKVILTIRIYNPNMDEYFTRDLREDEVSKLHIHEALMKLCPNEN